MVRGKGKIMTVEDVLKKSVLPLAFMAFWCWTAKTIMAVSGCTDPVLFLLLLGFPFGVHRMLILFIPKGYDIGGTVGMAAFGLIIGAAAGTIVLAAYLIRAVVVLAAYLAREAAWLVRFLLRV